MSRFALRSALLIVAAAVALPAAAQTPVVREGTAPISRYDRTSLLPKRLALVVNLDVSAPRKNTLEDVLDKLADLYDLTIDIDDKSFQKEGVKDLLAMRVSLDSLPRFQPMAVSTLVEAALSRLPARLEATYLLQDDVIFVTTKTRVRAERADLEKRARNFVYSIYGLRGFWDRSSFWNEQWEIVLDLLAETADQEAALTERSRPATWIKARSWEKGRNPW
jgi:hypothetical protein